MCQHTNTFISDEIIQESSSRVYMVSRFFLSKDSMTRKKLLELTYYAYAWTLTLLNDSNISYHLFSNRIEAWVHGPTIPDLFPQYESCGWEEIPQTPFSNPNFFSEKELDILEQVWEVYGGYTDAELEWILHHEFPGQNARKGIPLTEPSTNLIKDEDIYIFFREQAEKDV